MVHAAGGEAVLAHPGYYWKDGYSDPRGARGAARARTRRRRARLPLRLQLARAVRERRRGALHLGAAGGRGGARPALHPRQRRPRPGRPRPRLRPGPGLSREGEQGDPGTPAVRKSVTGRLPGEGSGRRRCGPVARPTGAPRDDSAAARGRRRAGPDRGRRRAPLPGRAGRDREAALGAEPPAHRDDGAAGGHAPRSCSSSKRPNRMRTEFTVEGQKGVRALDGRTAWEQLPLPGERPRPMSPEDAVEARAQADVDLSPLVDAAAKGYTVELVGRDRLPGGDTWKLVVRGHDGPAAHDAPRRADAPRRPDRGPPRRRRPATSSS